MRMCKPVKLIIRLNGDIESAIKFNAFIVYLQHHAFSGHLDTRENDTLLRTIIHSDQNKLAVLKILFLTTEVVQEMLLCTLMYSD